jgi:uncharacterized membrane protein YgaE (UPF0421/DUF939 family)
VAAGLAWFVGQHVLGHTHPYFAPIVALISLGTSYGQRLRRVVEVTVGVAVGVFLGDLYTHVLGRGPWQIAVMVGLAMAIALLLDASPLLVNQVAVQSLVVVTVLPNPDAAFLRWTDALVGGAVALVAATVVPAAPLRRPREQAAVVVAKVAALLRASAASIEDGDVERALATLSDARTTDALVGELRAASDEGLSVVASSPLRWRHRSGLRQLSDLVEPLDFALRNTRVLARRIAVANYRSEPVPVEYAAFLRRLASTTETMAAELKADRMATVARGPLVDLAQQSSDLPRSRALSAEVVLAQMRSILADLLAVTGLDPLEATDQIPPFPANP